MSARWTLHHGDCLAWLRTLPSESVDSVVTDPPAGIAFMDKDWDHHKGGRAQWVAWLAEVLRECMRVLKPGGHALVWSLPRTSHWTACAVEDAGFEIRDVIYHLTAQGWPKSLDVSKAIDAAAGAEREVVGTRGLNRWTTADQSNVVPSGMRAAFDRANELTAPATDDAKRWQGWGTALKPAAEPWVLARKPIADTVAANVIAHGTGALNVDGCRVACKGGSPSAERRLAALASGAARSNGAGGIVDRTLLKRRTEQRAGESLGRWPANVVLSHAETCGDECDPACPVAALDAQSGTLKSGDARVMNRAGLGYGSSSSGATTPLRGPDEGGASRFFPVFHPFGYFAKAKTADQRGGVSNRHPTVKNLDLMRWLVRLITPRGGVVLDAFAGSGTTGVAALLEGARFLGAEQDADSHATASARLRAAELGQIVVAGEAPTVDASEPAENDDAQLGLFGKAATK